MKVIQLAVLVLGLSLLTGSVLRAVILPSPQKKMLRRSLRVLVLILGMSLLTGSVLEASIMYSPQDKTLFRLKIRNPHEKDNSHHDTEGSVSR